jgi:hypothetical protein
MPKFKIISDFLNIHDAQILENNTIEKYRNNNWFILNKAKTGKNISSIGGSYIIWSYDKCKEEALKYNNRTEFNKNSHYCYIISYKNGWLDEICFHMDFIRYSRNYWSYDKCKEEALKYNTRNKFFNAHNNAYNSALKNGWLDEICVHMEKIIKPKNYWNYDKCKEESLKYNTKTEFKEKSKSAYRSSLTNGWLDEICSHMIGKKNQMVIGVICFYVKKKH